MTLTRTSRILIVAAACACGAAATPVAVDAGPVWTQVGPIGIAPGLRVADRAVPVMYHGQWLLAMHERRQGRDLLIVDRYDRDLLAWIPVGGPLNRMIDGAPEDVRMLPVGDELYVTWVEHRDGARFAVVARLEETRTGSVRWRAVGDVLPGSGIRDWSPSLVHARGALWIVWLGVDRAVRFARLDDGAWRELGVAMRGRHLSDPQAIEYGGDIYVAVGDEEVTRGDSHDADNRPELYLRDSAQLVRLALGAGDPRLTPLERFSAPTEDLDDGVDAWVLTALRDAPPLVAWHTHRRSALTIERLTGHGVVRLARVENLIEATPFLLSQVQETIIVATAMPADAGMTELGYLLVHRFDARGAQALGRDIHLLPSDRTPLAMAPDERGQELLITATTPNGGALAFAYRPPRSATTRTSLRSMRYSP